MMPSQQHLHTKDLNARICHTLQEAGQVGETPASDEAVLLSSFGAKPD